jgi:hypothetical protein
MLGKLSSYRVDRYLRKKFYQGWVLDGCWSGREADTSYIGHFEPVTRIHSPSNRRTAGR